MGPLNGYWFTSTRFRVEPGEDEEVNPGRYGRQLAHWLQFRLKEHGYPQAEVVPEDWGWCVMCRAQPFKLWVGCGNVESEGSSESAPIVWHCFAVAEVPLLARLFRRANGAAELASLNSALQTILGSTGDITLVSEP